MELLEYIKNSKCVIDSIKNAEDEVSQAISVCLGALRKDRKIIFCGNGGSAADSQHLAAEFMGRFLLERNPLPAISLTVDTSALTAISNDYGFENVFKRQLLGVGNKGDVLIGLSTSGNSKNIVAAFKAAKSQGISTIALTGGSNNLLDEFADVKIKVNSTETNFIQEAHIVIGHYICMKVEQDL